MRVRTIALIACAAAVIVCGCTTLPVPGDTISAIPRPSGAAWYPGDLHSHSTWSDGDSDVATVLAWAAGQGLEFFVLTDHDTSASGKPGHWFDPDYRSAGMVLLYGAEWTTARGHANTWSAAPFDYGDLWQANRALSASDAIAAAHAQDALFSINHPTRATLAWQYGFTDGAGTFTADTLEVWNAPFNLPFRNRRSVDVLWDDLLTRGMRVTAVGGSDSHQLAGLQRYFNPAGWPTTWVYASDRSGQAILEGIRDGHVSISYRPQSVRLDFTADADGDGAFEAMVGDRIPARVPVDFAVSAVPPEATESNGDSTRPYVCLIYKNGRVFARYLLGAGAPAHFTDTPGDGDYYRAELRGGPVGGVLQRYTLGRTVALTNPIYAGSW